MRSSRVKYLQPGGWGQRAIVTPALAAESLVDDVHDGRRRDRLAREYPAVGHLLRCQRRVVPHQGRALDQTGHTGRAVAALARRRWSHIERARRLQEGRAVAVLRNGASAV